MQELIKRKATPPYPQGILRYVLSEPVLDICKQILGDERVSGYLDMAKDSGDLCLVFWSHRGFCSSYLTAGIEGYEAYSCFAATAKIGEYDNVKIALILSKFEPMVKQGDEIVARLASTLQAGLADVKAS